MAWWVSEKKWLSKKKRNEEQGLKEKSLSCPVTDASSLVDVDVAHMFEVMREMEVNDSEVVPIPGVDGATLGEALEFREAHAVSGANEARDDAYAASVDRDMLFGLVSFNARRGSKQKKEAHLSKACWPERTTSARIGAFAMEEEVSVPVSAASGHTTR
jgi:hypothetical protein